RRREAWNSLDEPTLHGTHAIEAVSALLAVPRDFGPDVVDAHARDTSSYPRAQRRLGSQTGPGARRVSGWSPGGDRLHPLASSLVAREGAPMELGRAAELSTHVDLHAARPAVSLPRRVRREWAGRWALRASGGRTRDQRRFPRRCGTCAI